MTGSPYRLADGGLIARDRPLGFRFDGRAYTGRQALKLGLIDAIGGEPEARAWLAAEKSVPASLPVRELRAPGLRERVLGEGADGLLTLLMKTLLSQRVSLDGAQAVWQPSATAE